MTSHVIPRFLCEWLLDHCLIFGSTFSILHFPFSVLAASVHNDCVYQVKQSLFPDVVHFPDALALGLPVSPMHVSCLFLVVRCGS